METPVTLSPSLVYLPRDFHHLVYLSLDCWWLPRAGTGRGGVGISFAAAEATYHIPPLNPLVWPAYAVGAFLTTRR